MPYKVTRDEDYLEHHGIKGQKWGDRNGPPYPLSAAEHRKVVSSYIPDRSKEVVKTVTRKSNDAVKTITKKSNEVVDKITDKSKEGVKAFTRKSNEAVGAITKKSNEVVGKITVKSKEGVKAFTKKSNEVVGKITDKSNEVVKDFTKKNVNAANETIKALSPLGFTVSGIKLKKEVDRVLDEKVTNPNARGAIEGARAYAKMLHLDVGARLIAASTIPFGKKLFSSIVNKG